MSNNSKCPICGNYQEVFYCDSCSKYWCDGLYCPSNKPVKSKHGRYEQVSSDECPKCGRKGQPVK